MLTVVQHGGGLRGKPPEVVRGYSSRLPWVWDSLCFAVPLNDSTRDSARDLVYNVPPSAVVGTPVWTRDNRGNAALYLNTTSHVDYPDTPAHNLPSTAITVYVRFRRAGTGDPAGGLLAKRWGPSSDLPGWSWTIQHTDVGDNTLGAELGVDLTMWYWEAPGYVVPTTEWLSAFLRWQSPETGTLTVLGERGQILTTSVSPWTISGAISYQPGEPIRINALQTTNHYNCDYSQGMVWARKLSTTEMQALVADPYGWYSPHRSTVGISSPYPVVFGAGEMRGGTGQAGGLH